MKTGFSTPEIEQAALSAMLQWPESRSKGLANLTDKHFYHHPNRVIFQQIGKAVEENKPVELVAFTEILGRQGLLEAIGGAHYVTVTWVDTCHSPAAMDYYIELLSEDVERRMLQKECFQVAKSNLAQTEKPVQSTIAKLSEIPVYQPAKETTLADAVEAKIERMQRGEDDPALIRTGLVQLDLRSPLWKSDMPLISGERKAGKSILALSIAVNVAKQGIGLAYYSLEDSERKVVDRLLSSLSRVPLTKQNHVSNLTAEELTKSARAASELKKLPIHVFDHLLDLQKIVASIKQLAGEKKIGLAIVDYGQLVKTSVGRDRSREQEVAQVSRTFRLAAMEMELPIILLSQLNMDGFTRESRALEQDCTAMWKLSVDHDDAFKRWIEIPFQRNGESNVRFPVTFHGWCARVENYEKEQL